MYLFTGMSCTVASNNAKVPVETKQTENENGKTLSPYFVVISKNPETDNLPLKATEADVNIVGVIADVTIRQTYINTGKNTIEAIYTFPLSTSAAIYAMKMSIGKRTITAKINEKEKARKDYEKAKTEGNRASLLEQNRPNVFTMNVANIAVNDTIVVELKYTELLIPEEGTYSFVYPTVVGPRYSNKTDSIANKDSKFVNAPYTHEAEMPTYKFNFKLKINSGIPIQNISCASHKIQTSYPNINSAIVKLDPTETKGGNRDLVINYSLQGNKIETGIMLFENGNENFFLMMVQPPKKVQQEDIPAREYIFIVDVSGSMHGFPLEISKKLLRNLIVNLKPTDKFNVVLFAGSTGLFNEKSVNANEINVTKAIQFIDKQQGGGGTELINALNTAYEIPRASINNSRSFVLISDGYVDVENEAFDLIRKKNSNGNFFSFGIGSSVNRYLMEGLAFMGNGEPIIVEKSDLAEKQAEKFRKYINSPVLTQIKTKFESIETYDVEPISIPDMLAEKPVVVFGKYKGKALGKVTISGLSGQSGYEKTIDFSKVQANKSNAAIQYLWARERIKLLDYYDNEFNYSDSIKQKALKKQITGLGLKYSLMTKYTSFIAIDEKHKIDNNGKKVSVKQALPLPEGVSDLAVAEDNVSSEFEISSSDMLVQEDNVVFQVVETMPVFVGGDQALMNFLSSNIIYPEAAKKNNIQGRVIVQFEVDIDGSIKNVEVVRSVSPELDAEAIRVIKKMPKWIPGKQRGKPVKVKYTLPVNFKLS